MPLYSSIYGQEDPTFYGQVLGQPQPSRRPGLFEGLFMSGAGLMGGKDWSEGMTQGMKGFGQGIEMGQQQASRDMTNQVQMAQVQNSMNRNRLEQEKAAKKAEAGQRLQNYVRQGGDLKSPEGQALLFDADMGEQAISMMKPQAQPGFTPVKVVGQDGQAVWSSPTDALGKPVYVEPSAPRNVQTVTTREGVYTVKPDGTLGNKLGETPRAGNGMPNAPSGYRYNGEGSLEPIPGGPADKPEGAFKAPSGYRLNAQGTGLEAIPGGPADKPSGTPAQANEAAKKTLQLDNLGTSINSYEKELDGLTRTDLASLAAGTPTEKAAALSSLHTNLMINMKNLFELGALSGPDYQLMKDSVGGLTDAGTLVNPGNLATRLKVVKENLNNARKNLASNYGGKPPTQPAPGGDPFGLR